MRRERCATPRHSDTVSDETIGYARSCVASAIEKVRVQQPAAYMKIFALLVPRDMKVEHSGGVKAMTDEQLEAGIEAIQRMLEARAGDQAKVIEAVPEPVALPAPSREPRRKRGAEAKASPLLPDERRMEREEPGAHQLNLIPPRPA